jgi:hypothetical protein
MRRRTTRRSTGAGSQHACTCFDDDDDDDDDDDHDHDDDDRHDDDRPTARRGGTATHTPGNGERAGRNPTGPFTTRV